MKAGCIWASLFVFLSGLLPLWAQQFAQLRGHISDPTGGAVEGATVSIVNEDTGFRRTSQSQPDGDYVVASLQPGLYKITVRKEGFRTLIHFGIKLNAAHTAQVDFALTLGSMQETITVEGSPVVFNTEDASVSTALGRDQIERLPATGRGLLNLLELAPGTVVTPATRGEAGQFTANGQRANSHYFTVDGVSVNTGVSGGGLPAQATGGALPAVTAFGSFHNLVSLHALDEFRVQTSTAAPEIGRLPGVHVALTSRSGSSEFHGSLSEHFRNGRLDANDWFANRDGSGRAPLRFNDFGAALGGPIRRDRTFFFASYERLRLRQPYTWQSPVPSLAARQNAVDWLQPALNLFPLPTGPDFGPRAAEWTGHPNRPSRLDAGSMRLDHALTSRVSLFARYNYAPSSSEFGGWQVDQLSLQSKSLTAAVNARLAPHFIEDFRVNASYSDAQSLWRQASGGLVPDCYLQPLTAALTLNNRICESFFRFSIAGMGDLVFGRESENLQKQWNLLETMAFDRGRHQFRFGADYRRLAPIRRSPGTSVSALSEGIADLLANRNLWISISKTDYASSLLEEFSVFAQDSWRLSDRLTLTYGLRWELNPPPKSSLPVFGLETATGIFGPLPETPIWPLRYDNFAPRLGAAYRLTRNGGTVVRAGAGLYYDSSLSVATDLVNGGPFNVSLLSNQAAFVASMVMSYGFLPNLRLPQVWQWNLSVDQTLGGRDALSVGYVGSAGRHLLRREMGGPGTSELLRLVMATNHGSSDYNSLQVQYRRRMAQRLQALVSYAWSHSIDTDSADPSVEWVGSGLGARRDRGASDFDARHVLTASFSYSLPSKWSGFSIDGILHARSGFPINVLDAENYLGVRFANVFRPDLIPGQPVWIGDRSAPGGRRLNRGAFQPAPGSLQGGLGRNAIRGFGMAQLDLALRREYPLGERAAVLVGIEVGNLMNQANFADPVQFLSSPLFGQSLSMLNLMLGTGSPGSGLAPALQIGGARSMQLVLRFRF